MSVVANLLPKRNPEIPFCRFSRTSSFSAVFGHSMSMLMSNPLLDPSYKGVCASKVSVSTVKIEHSSVAASVVFSVFDYYYRHIEQIK